MAVSSGHDPKEVTGCCGVERLVAKLVDEKELWFDESMHGLLEGRIGVGGVEFSRHQYGDGSDLDASGWSVEELGDICDDLGADYVGLYEDGHTHCDWREVPLDPTFFPEAFHSVPARPVHNARIEPGDPWRAPAEGFDEGEPFRRWDAWDSLGNHLVSVTGRTFGPPSNARRVRVEVGGQLVVDHRM